jgi:hypothetical protein
MVLYSEGVGAGVRGLDDEVILARRRLRNRNERRDAD